MKNAKSLLDTLMQGGSGLGQQAKQTWDGQSTGTKGAIAGGLLGLFLGGGRGGLGGLARVGGAALIGSMASKAYAEWQAGKDGQRGDADEPALLEDDSEAADDRATRMLQAMIAAAKADGQVTDDERERISAQLQELGLGDEARAMIAEELNAPLDFGRVAELARTPAEAAEIYAASLMAVDPEGAAEKGYLAMLAARLQLDPTLVAKLHAQSASMV